MKARKNGSAKGAASRGFTLIELLVVVAVMAILLAVSLSGGKSGRQAMALKSSSADLISLVEMTRQSALTHNTTAQLMVCIDPSQPGQYLRQVISVYQDQDANGNTVWVRNSSDLVLRDNVFFDTDCLTKPSTASILPTQAYFNTTTMNPGSGALWAVYSFSSNGTCTQGGAALVLTSGVMNGSSLQTPNTTLVDGFMIQRLGSVISFQSPTQITQLLGQL